MNLIKKTLFVLSATALSFGFASCSDDDNDSVPNIKTVWSLNETTSDIQSENAETIEAIQNDLSKSTFMMKSITLSSNGEYESTLNTTVEKGIYKLTSDSLILTVKSPLENGSAIQKNRAYAVKSTEVSKMTLTEDITSDFSSIYEGVDKVTIDMNLEVVAINK